ncbi:MAG: hypothetical protein GY851_00050, partial [bacterium]|nr:hypothetical protein [bacterium]
MPFTIAVISDLHYDSAEAPELAERQGSIADILLLRAVHRVNRLIKPDVAVILGDLVNRGGEPDALDDLRALRAIADLLESPCIAIPGNHDDTPGAFYSVFDRPDPIVDIGGVRLLPFIDPEEPGYNASRPEHEIERFAKARHGFDGPVVALQHVPVFTPGTGDSPYNYTNAEAIMGAMTSHGVNLAICGHWHQGMDIADASATRTVVAPAACESPYAFLEIRLDGDNIDVMRHTLRMPPELGLVDAHVHTSFAYCNENMDIAKAMMLGERFGLTGLAFSEHAGQLYFGNRTYWRGDFLAQGVDWPDGRQPRMDAYFDALAAASCPNASRGLEVDCDFSGRPVIAEGDRSRARFLIGAIHHLDALRVPEPNPEAVADEFMATLEKFLATGIAVLAHPFRIFRRAKLATPEGLFDPMVRLLKRYGVAAEINFHTNEPSEAFVRKCIDADVKLTFGSDA